MLNTTLCYVTRGSQVLMLHRVKKKVDINKDKWIGIGGKFEGEESPDECLLREAKEETGLTLTSWQCRGVVTFLNDTCEGEYMYLFTADGFEGEMTQCDEGDLQWVEREFLNALPKWEGDQIFLDLLWQNAAVFPADPALPRGYPSGSDTEREKDTLRLEPTDVRLSA